MLEVVDLFLELAAIASPPGEERSVADVVRRYLRDLRLDPDEDAFGNVYARIEPTAAGRPATSSPSGARSLPRRDARTSGS